MTPTSIVAYLTLFAGVAFLFGLISLLLGRLLRVQAPSLAKLEPYECGEPAVGSTAVRFDLRFYVVALVFLIFEVEVALFFPPATIFGKAVQLTDPHVSSAKAADLCGELGITKGPWGSQQMYPSREEAAPEGRRLALAAMADLGLFFAVILLGFAYVWWQGDLNWVRAMGGQGAPERNDAHGRVVST
jgi:NADH-quinone oxidoreductase subunit A